MSQIWKKVKDEVRSFLISQGVDENEVILENPPDSVEADLAFPCFGLAKKMSKNPMEIAKELAVNFVASGLLKDCQASGPYLNFFVDWDKVATLLLSEISECGVCYGSGPRNNKKVGIEFIQPNTNKPLSVGHARNAVLGWSISEVMSFVGNDVIKINLFNDRGTHICKSMLAYQKWGNGATPESSKMKPDHFVGKYYVMFTKEAEVNPELENEAQEMLKKWEEGDADVVRLWQQMNEWFYAGVGETLEKFGIVYDQIYYESKIYKYGKEIIDQALTKEQCYKLPDGAVEVDLEEQKLGKKILLRKDGTAVYMVQDLYLAKKKFEELNLDLSINVVGDEQKYHFEVLFELLERFNIVDREKNYHLAYGMVNMVGGKMSSRKGTVVKWDDLVDELTGLAKNEIKQRETEIDEKELEARALKVALGAIKFHLLNHDKNKTIVFDKEKVVKFEGETGPYVMYTFARIASIANKISDNNIVGSDEVIQIDNEMKVIVRKLALFNDVIQKTAGEYNPALLSKYLFEVCQLFNMFYHKHRIIDEGKGEYNEMRFEVAKGVKTVLANGMKLLGIELIEKM